MGALCLYGSPRPKLEFFGQILINKTSDTGYNMKLFYFGTSYDILNEVGCVENVIRKQYLTLNAS